MPTKSKNSCVAVFCGSSYGNKDSYAAATVELAEELIARDIDLVYGGGGTGLMGLVSQTVLEGGRHVLGIMPKSLLDDECTGETVGVVILVNNMHQRKAEIARFSDCFIALPGEYGTLEEFSEMISWAQLSIHNKPVGLLNVDGFYDSLLLFIDKAVDDRFIIPSQRDIVVSAPTAKELMQKLEEYKPVKPLLENSRWEGQQQQKVACNHAKNDTPMVWTYLIGRLGGIMGGFTFYLLLFLRCSK